MKLNSYRKWVFSLLLDDAYQEFLYDLKIKNYSPRTIKGYTNNNKAFLNYLKNEFDIEEFVYGKLNM